MNQGGVESTGPSTCCATWPLYNKSFRKQVFFPHGAVFTFLMWDLANGTFWVWQATSLLFSWQLSYRDVSQTFVGARRGSKLLNHVQSRESIIPELSACSMSQQHHSTPASHPSSKEMTWKHRIGGGLAVNMRLANICMQLFEKRGRRS